MGTTGICIVDGVMDKFLFVEILSEKLPPFIREIYPNHYPKHSSLYVKAFLQENNINGGKHFQSPDSHPHIKNL